MQGLNNLASAAARFMAGTFCPTKTILSVATTSKAAIKSATLLTGAVIHYVINGVHYSKAALSEQAITNTDKINGKSVVATLTTGLSALLVVGLNAAGTVKTYMGAYRSFTETERDDDPTSATFGTNITKTKYVRSRRNDNDDGWQELAVESEYLTDMLPDVPETVCPIGIIKIPAVTAVAGFVPGTSTLDNSGTATLTAAATYLDLLSMPATAKTL